jgi:hypothetical protein
MTAGGVVISLDGARSRGRRRRNGGPLGPDPDALEAVYADAVQQRILRELSTFPRGFRERLGDYLERDTEHFTGALLTWCDFKAGRTQHEEEGFQDALAMHLRDLRGPHRDRLAKKKLLLLLFHHGRRTIDRTALTRHAIANAEAKLATYRERVRYALKGCTRAQERLDGAYLRGSRRGQPLDQKDRAAALKHLKRCRKDLREARAEVARTKELLADEAALVRDFTGCARCG